MPKKKDRTSRRVRRGGGDEEPVVLALSYLRSDTVLPVPLPKALIETGTLFKCLSPAGSAKRTGRVD